MKLLARTVVSTAIAAGLMACGTAADEKEAVEESSVYESDESDEEENEQDEGETSENTLNENEGPREESDDLKQEVDVQEDSNDEEETSEKSEAVVTFLNVDQGDATLIEGEDTTILIDAGRHDRDDVLPALQARDVTSLDVLIGTHPHADHIGQFESVLRELDVDEVWMSGDDHSTQTYEHALAAIDVYAERYEEPRAGDRYEIDPFDIEVFNPEQLTGDLHEGSVSFKVSHGDVDVVFTGDAEEETELDMIHRGHDLQADIFQLGHHGSSTSNIPQFLDEVAPEVAVYSAGADNQYGHPHDEVINSLQERSIETYGTDIHGDVEVTSNGASFEVSTSQSGNVFHVHDPQETSQATDSNYEDAKPSEQGCININEAGAQKLEDIIHIGEARAQSIKEHRPFQSVSGLDRIDGIGAGRLEEIQAEGTACVQ
ncbi:MBL fold metallo-hydrolase [Salsuginibacillus halophilus]|nr:MBL fold metallo-hydrolase [Salsuginibacillus halophilus]